MKPRIRPPFVIAFLVAVGYAVARQQGYIGGCGEAGPAGTGGRTPGQPVETRPPNAGDQKPAFAGQTRALFTPADVAFDVRVVAVVEEPWSLAFLPGDPRSVLVLVTEKAGRMRIVSADGKLSAPLAGVPKVDAGGQGGLLDVVLGPTFGADSLLYFSFSEPREGGNGTAVARARLVEGESPKLEDVTVIWRAMPTLASNMHFGSRLVFARDGNLFVTTGERSISEGRRQAQRLDSSFGKVVRIVPDGGAPQDNPFFARAGAQPEIYSIGHRNVQGAALHPHTGVLWTVEHGARGGDEINLVKSGADYGWPTITYGTEYTGGKIGEGITQRDGMEQPRYYWDPSIAPSGLAFYDADLFPKWKGSLFVGALAGRHLVRLTLDGERVVGEERLLVDRARIRDVRVGPEGALYVLTDEAKGQVLALTPRGGRARSSSDAP